MEPFDFIDPRTIPFMAGKSRGELYHLYKEGCSYFVTFRLWDAVVPLERSARSIQESSMLALQGGVTSIGLSNDNCAGSPPNQKHHTADEIAISSEPSLCLGSCSLEKPEIASIVQKAILHFEHQSYNLAAWCVMPNHVHVVFTPWPGHSPSDILHSWKSYTGHQANKILCKNGAFWERESFDHLIRSIDDFERFLDYVEEIPVAAGLCKVRKDWLWSSARRQV